jgi:hypothetical protein
MRRRDHKSKAATSSKEASFCGWAHVPVRLRATKRELAPHIKDADLNIPILIAAKSEYAKLK